MPLATRVPAICIAIFAAVGVIALALSSLETQSIARPETPELATPVALGAAAFEGSDFGGLSMDTLESHALPWRLVAAALVLKEKDRTPLAAVSIDTLNTILSRFGFLTTAEPINRPDGVKPNNRQLPLGFTYGYLSPIGGSKLLVSNLGCPACHGGVTYDQHGDPRPDKAWLGMPNTSINIEGFVQEVFVAIRGQIDKPSELLATARLLFPEMDWREELTLRWLAIPAVRDKISTLEEKTSPLPFPNGLPGATNGVAALKHQLEVPLLAGGIGDNGIVSVPELGGHVWRSSLLADGAYAPQGRDRQRPLKKTDIDERHLGSLAYLTTFFTIPSMGVSPSQAHNFRKDAEAIFTFLASTYKPQGFPGPINLTKARLGHATYERDCASCHGSYDWTNQRPELSLFPNWLGDVGTDPLRAQSFTKQLADAVASTPYGKIVSAKPTGQYAAPPLSGIWASAPYLHNGSVPSLWQLLTPSDRLEIFKIGGHALDFSKVGLRHTENGDYPEAYAPFSEPVWYETHRSGQSNGGHNQGINLKADDKLDLIEFLKLL
ncbi:hypothetical protein [Roseibium sediminis]|uniref:c-type cytochrome n=1 Tax=Roseibium sediminis TaxID=1775174 RepID=UPI00123E1021|nr:hypothetical protein [Roseibium sediminis]